MEISGKVVVVRRCREGERGEWLTCTDTYFVPFSPDAYGVALQQYLQRDAASALLRHGLRDKLEEELDAADEDLPADFADEFTIYNFIHSYEEELFADNKGRQLLNVDICEARVPEDAGRIAALRDLANGLNLSLHQRLEAPDDQGL